MNKNLRARKPNSSSNHSKHNCGTHLKKTRMNHVARDLCGCIFTLLICSIVHFKVQYLNTKPFGHMSKNTNGQSQLTTTNHHVKTYVTQIKVMSNKNNCFNSIIMVLILLIFKSFKISVYINQVVADDYSAYLDPIVSLVYILFLVWSCANLVRDSCLILLQTIPG